MAQSTRTQLSHRCTKGLRLLAAIPLSACLAWATACSPTQDPARSAPASPEPEQVQANDPDQGHQDHISSSTASSKEDEAMKEQLPEGFKSYAQNSIGNGKDCVAGVVTDEDGLKQRPVIAVTSGGSRSVVWARQLDGIEDAYQARATHCAQGDGTLYVLLQSDTDSSPALSQTVLSIARLDEQGGVLGVDPLKVPGTEGQAYSAYVGDVPADVEWKDGRLVVKGEYFFKSNPEDRKPFVVEIARDGGQG